MANSGGNDNFYDILVGVVSPIIQIAADYAGAISLPFARYVVYVLHKVCWRFTTTSGDKRFSVSAFDIRTRSRDRKKYWSSDHECDRRFQASVY
jgi:hypothetical protein